MSDLADNRPARTALAAVTLVVSVVLAIPVVTGSDGFPVSSQPMFAVPRDNLAEFVTARAVTASGEVVDLSMREIASTDDPLVAERLLLEARRTNSLLATCNEIAGRIERTETSVEIVRVRHNLDDGIGQTPAEIEVLERCQSAS